MNRRLSILMGIVLILVGAASLAFTLLMSFMGWDLWMWGAWRLWPLVVVAGGLLLVMAPFFARGKRGLGALFIPGVPILTSGSILLFTSFFNFWQAWSWLWPMTVTGLALGFLLAAISMRSIWLLAPAILIGANGLLLQFCAVTGFWMVWAALWAIEPLALGSSLLLIGVVRRRSGLSAAGLILCTIAGMGLMGMSAFLPGYWLIGLLGPVVLVLIGIGLLIGGLTRNSPAPAQ